ncbi:MAG: hypothetical protein U5K76_10960 [Woeseiaceae bacterium]|nr:hypothetical protein [Woeseiaceae bacterium]
MTSRCILVAAMCRPSAVLATVTAKPSMRTLGCQSGRAVAGRRRFDTARRQARLCRVPGRGDVAVCAVRQSPMSCACELDDWRPLPSPAHAVAQHRRCWCSPASRCSWRCDAAARRTRRRLLPGAAGIGGLLALCCSWPAQLRASGSSCTRRATAIAPANPANAFFYLLTGLHGAAPAGRTAGSGRGPLLRLLRAAHAGRRRLDVELCTHVLALPAAGLAGAVLRCCLIDLRSRI